MPKESYDYSGRISCAHLVCNGTYAFSNSNILCSFIYLGDFFCSLKPPHERVTPAMLPLGYICCHLVQKGKKYVYDLQHGILTHIPNNICTFNILIEFTNQIPNSICTFNILLQIWWQWCSDWPVLRPVLCFGYLYGLVLPALVDLQRCYHSAMF